MSLTFCNNKVTITVPSSDLQKYSEYVDKIISESVIKRFDLKLFLFKDLDNHLKDNIGYADVENQFKIIYNGKKYELLDGLFPLQNVKKIKYNDGRLIEIDTIKPGIDLKNVEYITAFDSYYDQRDVLGCGSYDENITNHFEFSGDTNNTIVYSTTGPNLQVGWANFVKHIYDELDIKISVDHVQVQNSILDIEKIKKTIDRIEIDSAGIPFVTKNIVSIESDFDEMAHNDHINNPNDLKGPKHESLNTEKHDLEDAICDSSNWKNGWINIENGIFKNYESFGNMKNEINLLLSKYSIDCIESKNIHLGVDGINIRVGPLNYPLSNHSSNFNQFLKKLEEDYSVAVFEDIGDLEDAAEETWIIDFVKQVNELPDFTISNEEDLENLSSYLSESICDELASQLGLSRGNYDL